jgi:hexosaminidase
VRDVADMYRRLRVVSLELEDVGLTHISGPQKLRRNLMGTLDPEPLEVMAGVIEPVSFHERYEGQKTDGLTALDRLVDAVVADPPSRQAIAREVDAAVDASYPGERLAAEMALRRRFMQWEQVSPVLEAWAHRSVRLSDIEGRAQQLGDLARVGLEALEYMDAHTQPPAAWQDSRTALISDAEKPSALVRFVFLPELRKLVEAAAKASPAK